MFGQAAGVTMAMLYFVFLLGTLLKMGKWFVAEEAEAEYMDDCRRFAQGKGGKEGGGGSAPPASRKSFDRFWDHR